MSPSVSAALVVVAVAAYGTLHSLLASRAAKDLVRRLIGPVADRLYRLGFNIVGAITLLPVLAIPALQPGPILYRLPSPLSWAFLLGQAGAVLLVAVGIVQGDAWHFLGIRQLLGPPEVAPSRFVTSGLYRYVRHPLYTGGLLFLWLTPWMTTTLLALYVCLSGYLYVGSIFEERRLEVEFGAAYADYRRRVPRLFPRLPAPPGA